MSDELVVRRATEDDLPAVLALLKDAMARSEDDRFVQLFRWKHLDNAFGPSPAWVALDGERLAAVRYLMRWEFERGDKAYRCVRAVDTATHPDYQGRGLFRRLTLQAIDELRDEGVAWIFNTPNDQSRPGYLKMGWQLVGTVPVPTRPLRLTGLARMARARVPADHFSAVTKCGDSASAVFGDEAFVAGLLTQRGASPRIRTRLSGEFLRWRFGGSLIEYRCVVRGDALCCFRIRNRGVARELALALVIAPSVASERAVVRAALRAARRDADYAVAIGERPLATFIPVPGTGPTLVWRAVCDADQPAASAWGLNLGDIELF